MNGATVAALAAGLAMTGTAAAGARTALHQLARALDDTVSQPVLDDDVEPATVAMPTVGRHRGAGRRRPWEVPTWAR